MSKFLPKKHITLEQSYFCLGARILPLIKDGAKIEFLWEKCKCTEQNTHHSFEDFLLTLDYLFMINLIKLNDAGEICLNY